MKFISGIFVFWLLLTSAWAYNLNSTEKAKWDLAISKLNNATLNVKWDKSKFQMKNIADLNKLKAKAKNEQLKSLIDYIIAGFWSKNYNETKSVINNVETKKVLSSSEINNKLIYNISNKYKLTLDYKLTNYYNDITSGLVSLAPNMLVISKNPQAVTFMWNEYYYSNIINIKYSSDMKHSAAVLDDFLNGKKYIIKDWVKDKYWFDDISEIEFSPDWNSLSYIWKNRPTDPKIIKTNKYETINSRLVLVNNIEYYVVTDWIKWNKYEFINWLHYSRDGKYLIYDAKKDELFIFVWNNKEIDKNIDKYNPDYNKLTELYHYRNIFQNTEIMGRFSKDMTNMYYVKKDKLSWKKTITINNSSSVKYWPYDDILEIKYLSDTYKTEYKYQYSKTSNSGPMSYLEWLWVDKNSITIPLSYIIKECSDISKWICNYIAIINWVKQNLIYDYGIENIIISPNLNNISYIWKKKIENKNKDSLSFIDAFVSVVVTNWKEGKIYDKISFLQYSPDNHLIYLAYKDWKKYIVNDWIETEIDIDDKIWTNYLKFVWARIIEK